MIVDAEDTFRRFCYVDINVTKFNAFCNKSFYTKMYVYKCIKFIEDKYIVEDVQSGHSFLKPILCIGRKISIKRLCYGKVGYLSNKL